MSIQYGLRGKAKVYPSEETLEDVRARMHAIQENEIDQLRELSKFLEMEIRFSEQYLDVLRDVKEDWIDEFVVIFTMRNLSHPSTV